MGSPAERSVPAPELAEVARTWWDVEHDPVVIWDDRGARFDLADPADRRRRLRLLHLAVPAEDPRGVAEVLAEAFAACDFPPTGDGVPPERAAATARAHGIRAHGIRPDGGRPGGR